MEKKSYSKVYTQFETQAMAYGRLKVALKGTEYFVRGDSEHLVVFKTTEDSYKPIPMITVWVKASTTPLEVQFIKNSLSEVTVVGMDIAWKVVDFILPMLRSARAEGATGVPSPV